MSFGIKCAAEALGYEFVSRLAADLNKDILEVYSHNLHPQTSLPGDLAKVVDYECDDSPSARHFKKPPSLTSPDFIALKEGVDILIGGPPCQGHSDLNNHSRRDDPKNALYLLMPALAYCLKPKAVIVENVRAVVHDKQQVVQRTRNLLEGMGYQVDEAVVLASSIGVPQSRRRHFLVAVEKPVSEVRIREIVEALHTEETRTVEWALAGINPSVHDPIFDEPSELSDRNKKRVAWLFDNDAFDLPDFKRPSCHKDKEHSYKSMYGRMKRGKPSQTITSGFGSPGQGRFIHPEEPRLITPHEAARLQFFPDSFHFVGASGTPKRTRLAEMIGNAVPPKLAYAIGLGVLGALP